MSITNSVFHSLQEGKNTMAVANIPLWVTGNMQPFQKKIANSYQDPFPVFRMTYDQTETIRDRMIEILSDEGLKIDTGLQTVSEKAPSEVEADKLTLLERLDDERLRAPLPARRIGFEFRTDKGDVEAAILEAMLDPSTPLPASSLADKKKLADVPLFRVHIFGARPSSRVCALSPIASHYDTRKKFEDRCSTDFLGPDAVALTTPHGSTVSPEDAFKHYPPDMVHQLGIANAGFIADMFNFLWIMKRDPLFTTKIGQIPATRSRHAKAAQYSPVHTLNINETELRRVKEERATAKRAKEISTALARDGKYSVPGLVLVTGYPNPVSGKPVADYARCANKEIRALATELLQRRADPDSAMKLAKLMGEYGNETSKGKYECERSIVHNVRLTKSDAEP